MLYVRHGTKCQGQAEKDKFGPCPHRVFSRETDIYEHYLHFIVEEPES